MDGGDRSDERSVGLDVPAELGYSDEHVWVGQSEGLLSLGITEYAADHMGDLVYVDLPEVGTRFDVGDELVQLESSKAVQPVIAPVAGTVRHVNGEVAEDPEIVNNDPYGEGWMVKFEPEDDEPELLDDGQYRNLLRKSK